MGPTRGETTTNVELEGLVCSQGEIHERISRAFSNLRKLGGDNITLGAIESRLQLLDEKWMKFSEQHQTLVQRFWNNLIEHDYRKNDYAEMAEETYAAQRTAFLDLATKMRKQEAPAASECAHTSRPPKTTLPRLNIPKFSGKYEDWPAFRDIFESIIRKDPNLSNVEKLHFLKTTLKGEAEELVRNITTTEANFALAWSLISEHYENPRVLLRTHLTNFTTLTRMTTDSVVELKRVFLGMTNTATCLDGIGQPITSSHLFMHMVVELLHSRSRQEWKESVSGTKEPPTYEKLKDFLERRIQTLEAVNPIKLESKSPPATKSNNSSSRSVRSHHAQKQGERSTKCVVCQNEHFLLYCNDYRAKAPKEREGIVEKHNLCLNCLGKYPVAECQSKKSCMVCRERHHTTIHDAYAASSCVASARTNDNATTSLQVGLHGKATGTTVLLATARVLMTDGRGECHRVRALIDPGSEVSLVAETLVQRLRIPRSSSTMTIYGVGGQRSGSTRGQVTLRLTSTYGNATFTAVALVLPRLTMYRRKSVSPEASWPHLKDLQLADPEFLSPDTIEILLGADIYATIIREGLRTSSNNNYVAQQTILGWIISGTMNAENEDDLISAHQCTVDMELGPLVRRFWEQEEPSVAPTLWTENEQRCEDLFLQTHSRSPSGRYVVRLPVSPTLPALAHTRHPAKRLLATMERKFDSNLEFRDLYRDFMQEYERLRQTPAPAIGEDITARVCFLPHHGVIKEASSSTKLRVVFNGSQRLPTGQSLNDHLLVGPNLLPSLADTLLRWRRHQFAMASDIEKMYRQVLVHPLDRDLQRIVWRYDKDDDLIEYTLNTVTYGLSCAPFLAIRALKQLAIDEGERFPKGAKALQTDVYVDDILTGASSLDEALDLQSQLIGLCKAGGFPLRKWAANSRTLLHAIPTDHQMQQNPRSWNATIQPTLGLQWHPQEDSFSFTIRPGGAGTITKRVALSETARLFDPLGWLAPSIIRAKILLQTTWLRHLDWDTPLSPADAHLWQGFREELPCLATIRIPRWIYSGLPQAHLELHGFADASERAYAAVIYLRAATPTETRVTLLMAKTRVAPIKQVSLPRLELCAATLLGRLATHAANILSTDRTAITLWSDSTVALAWIQGHPSRWKTYVANRVSEIQRTLPEATWRHVPSSDNPADCASRGLPPGKLPSYTLWWNGPTWLTSDRAAWPQPPQPVDEAPEERGTVHIASAAEPEESPILRRFSRLHRLFQVTAWCRRWRIGRREPRPQHVRRQSSSISLTLRSEELEEAESIWIRATQATYFEAECTALRNQQSLPGRSTLVKLRPFLDEQGLLRVGGRLKHSLLCYDTRHPVILAPRSHLTRLVIEACHQRTLHGGVQLTLGTIRQRYWIPRGRSEVKKHLHRCLTCVR